MLMRKLLSAVFCFLIFVPAACANSAPSYWQAYPSSEMLAVDAACPVTVEEEQLTFDFSDNQEYGSDYSPAARVTAVYEMANPTKETQTVQMAFPFVASAARLSMSQLDIEYDGQSVPYEIYLDPETADSSEDAAEQFSYGGVGQIQRQELSVPGFDLRENAVLYRFLPAASGSEEQELTLTFRVDPMKTRVLGSGFTRFSYSDDGVCTLGARISARFPVELLVLGGAFSYESALADENGNPADRSLCETQRETVITRQYLLDRLRAQLDPETSDAVSDTQLLNLCLARLDAYSSGTGFAVLEDLTGAIYANRIVTLVYTVEFPPESTRKVSVTYPASGIMDRRETVTPTYRYTYLLSPAKNWADFGALNIRIIPPGEAPYVIDSTIALDKGEDGVYKAALDGLPDTELTFTLYAKSSVTFLDRVQKDLSGLRYMLLFFWPFLAAILAVTVILTVAAAKRKKHRGNRGQ